MYNNILTDINILSDINTSLKKYCSSKDSHDLFILAAYYGHVNLMDSICKIYFYNSYHNFDYSWNLVQYYILIGICNSINYNPIESLQFGYNFTKTFYYDDNKKYYSDSYHYDEFGIEIIQMPLSDVKIIIIDEDRYDDRMSKKYKFYEIHGVLRIIK